MKVIMLDTKKTVEVDDCYGARLIEQGKAILAKVAEATVTPSEAKDEKPKATKNGKG